jgi:hypothetical protein
MSKGGMERSRLKYRSGRLPAQSTRAAKGRPSDAAASAMDAPNENPTMAIRSFAMYGLALAYAKASSTTPTHLLYFDCGLLGE